MRLTALKSFILKTFKAVPFLLLLSLALHTVDMHHTHPVHGGDHHEHSGESEAGSVLAEYMHMGSNKFVFIVASIFTLPFVLPPTLLVLLTVLLLIGYTRFFIQKADWYEFWQHYLFSRGILNPKLF
jgi:hypothetical protein